MGGRTDGRGDMSTEVLTLSRKERVGKVKGGTIEVKL